MTASEESISGALLAWYDRHARALPWRSPPGEPPPNDKAWPYRVWLSEVMLQQTGTVAVSPYFKRFIDKWPTVESLAAAPEEDVMAAWAGLGYYSRARNLIAAARAITERGAFPETEADLRKLPGVGPYIAAAVAAIAFGEAATVVDANVERVVARLFAIADPLPKARREIRQRTEGLTPADRPGDFAQAMMDLGATICTPRDPRCLLCPLSAMCEARANGDPARFPVKPPKKAKPTRKGTAWWIESDGKIWLVRRPGKGMLGGMRALPDDGWSARGDGSGEPPIPGDWRDAGAVSHGFTHFDLELRVMVLKAGDLAGEGEWWPLDDLAAAGLPTLFARAAARAVA